ncbi:MAG: GxxExxY protein [Sphingomonadales bacterium]|nr:GxxExxY protein [Sphingomonadales bacterium]
MTDIDELSAEVIDAAIRIHRELGPGLLETVYETLLAASLVRAGFTVDRQRPIDIHFDGMAFPGAFRIDILVEGQLIIEVKSVEQLSRAHGKQLLTYLRLTNQPVGLLLNFAGATMKEGIKRVVNDYSRPRSSSASPRLRVKSNLGE